MDNKTSLLLGLVGLFVGAIAVIVFNYFRNSRMAKKAESLLDKAQKDADKLKRDYIAEAKEEAYKLKLEAEKDIKERKNEVKEAEDRLLVRENNIDRRDQTIQNRENQLEQKEQNLIEKQNEIQAEQVKIEGIKKEQVDLLEKIAGFTKNQARDMVMKKVEDMMNLEIVNYIHERETEAKLEADKKSKELLVGAMQKYASDVANEQTITVVNLPNDEMKGRIIGREGRNIRTLESVTGVDLIIDDTPEAIVLSSFDPYRREVARITIENLIKDGRIHPTRIEELYDKTIKDMKVKIRDLGETALFELGITKVDPDLVEILGKLYFRTSYGQNALQHSIEVANLSGLIAGELGENVMLAKRAGLFHDIGKAVDHEIEGSHVEIGAELARKYKESKEVINAIESHHGDVETTSVISTIVAIADALSASRPGARNDSLENYVKRLQDLEKIATNVEGVDKTYAVQAGREIRVIVKPEVIDDLGSFKVAREIKEKIEEQLQYPGTIKVTVIRETRATEEAK
ncbi:MAG: ribonuclease Y [Erysipelotrichaceae bacterium]|nr:ribonuclease Y [Erysipelotrichaceae bacterium]